MVVLPVVAHAKQAGDEFVSVVRRTLNKLGGGGRLSAKIKTVRLIYLTSLQAAA